jgi:hypothetical protein
MFLPTYTHPPPLLPSNVAIFLPTYLFSYFLMGFPIGKKIGHIGK